MKTLSSIQTSPQLSRHEFAGRAFGISIGNLFCGFFGMAWIVLGLRAAGRMNPITAALLSFYLGILVAISTYTMVRTRGSLDRSEAHRAMQKKINRWFGLVNLVQWGLIFAAVYGLAKLKLSDWILPAIILIVGIHFFPLARLFRAPRHYVTGAIMVAWAVVYPILFSAGKGGAIGAVGTGAILWMSGAFMCRQALRLLRQMDATDLYGDGIAKNARA